MDKILKWFKGHRIDFLGALVLGLAIVFLFASGQAVAGQNDVSNHVIRLHVLAHDDSEVEQSVKLLVRDAVWEVVSELVQDVRSVSQARDIIEGNLHYIEDTAWHVLQDLGSSHDARARLVQDLNFPAMTYGTVMLPQGQYQALQVVIGDGAGSNWWCIMFPPMCLMDVTRGKQVDTATDDITLRARFRLFSR